MDHMKPLLTMLMDVCGLLFELYLYYRPIIYTPTNKRCCFIRIIIYAVDTKAEETQSEQPGQRGQT